MNNPHKKSKFGIVSSWGSTLIQPGNQQQIQQANPTNTVYDGNYFNSESSPVIGESLLLGIEHEPLLLNKDGLYACFWKECLYGNVILQFVGYYQGLKKYGSKTYFAFDHICDKGEILANMDSILVDLEGKIEAEALKGLYGTEEDQKLALTWLFEATEADKWLRYV